METEKLTPEEMAEISRKYDGAKLYLITLSTAIISWVPT